MDESCCSWYLGGLVPMRTKIRAERGIEVFCFKTKRNLAIFVFFNNFYLFFSLKGAIWKDVCSVLWCPQLTMYQMYNEAKNTRPLV